MSFFVRPSRSRQLHRIASCTHFQRRHHNSLTNSSLPFLALLAVPDVMPGDTRQHRYLLDGYLPPCNLPRFDGIFNMSEKDEARSRFYSYYERYLDARHHMEEPEIQRYAMMSLVQIHLISGSSDQAKAAEVMRNELMSELFSEDQILEMYQTLRKHSTI